MEIGDCIGSESSTDIELEVNPQPPRNRRLIRRSVAVAAAGPDYPPPMSSITRTEDHPSHVPWVMRRYYSGDGRLIIREEKVRHHEYFQVHRSNGRLVLNLVPLDDAVEGEESSEEEKEEEEEGVQIADRDDEGVINDPTVGESVSRCCTYNNCGGFAAVAPPPVRT